VVQEKKIFEDLTKVSLFCPLLGPKRGQPLYSNLNPFPKHILLPSLVEIGLLVLEKLFKGKFNRRTPTTTPSTTDGLKWQKLT